MRPDAHHFHTYLCLDWEILRAVTLPVFFCPPYLTSVVSYFCCFPVCAVA